MIFRNIESPQTNKLTATFFIIIIAFMEKARLTLQNRIISLLVISSILIIAIFTFIQINNQITNINQQNLYQANLSSRIVEDNLGAIIKQALPQDIPSLTQSSLKGFEEAKIIQGALIFDPEGKIIASTDEWEIERNVSYKDLNKIEALENLLKQNTSLLPEIDKTRQRINIYSYLKIDPLNQKVYVAKLTYSLGNIQEALIGVYKPVIISTILVILLNILLAYMLSKTVIGPIKILNEVTKTIAGGDLTVRTYIRTDDELEELGATFNYMTDELIKMKERAENANPLTKLPGNIVIHEQIENRIKENKKFVVIYCDLDNFKAFNDKYGIAKGDEAIKLTAEIFKEAAKIKGSSDDFLGHEGGDDFILITTPENSQAVADYITSEFDKRVRILYDEEDLSKGFIVAHARDGSVKQFPIMTISLAGITNEHRFISSYGEVTNIAAEVKKKAKAVEGSVFVLDKRLS